MRRNDKHSEEPAQTDQLSEEQRIYAKALSDLVKELNAKIESEADRQQSAARERTLEVDLLGFAFHVLERFWLILLAATIGAVGAWFSARNALPVYVATAKVYVVSPGDSLISFSDLQLGSALTRDYQEVFRTWEVHEMVRKDLGLNYSYEQMQSMIGVSNPESTRILYISAVSPDPAQAAAIANAYAKAAKTFIVETMRGNELTDFSVALAPTRPINSGMQSTVLKGFLLGSVLAIGLLFLQYLLDDRPQTPEDIMNYAGIPTLAVLSSEDQTVSPKREAGSRASPRQGGRT